jgi:hypothetical protein
MGRCDHRNEPHFQQTVLCQHRRRVRQCSNHSDVALQFEDGYRDSTQCLDVTLLSRLNNKRTGCIIIVMQRLHEDDLVGHVLPARRLDGALVPAIARRPPGGAALRSSCATCQISSAIADGLMKKSSVRPPLARPGEVDHRIDQHIGGMDVLRTDFARDRLGEDALRRLGRREACEIRLAAERRGIPAGDDRTGPVAIMAGARRRAAYSNAMVLTWKLRFRICGSMSKKLLKAPPTALWTSTEGTPSASVADAITMSSCASSATSTSQTKALAFSISSSSAARRLPLRASIATA